MSDNHTGIAMRMPQKLALASYIVLLNFALTIALVRFWPSATAAGVSPEEARFLITAALAGALGSSIHLATSFVEYAGCSNLVQSWGWWYVMRPGIGSALAIIVYFVLRAGLITGAGQQATANLNPFGIASVAALSGMFSKQALQKLREVFEQICTTRPV